MPQILMPFRLLVLVFVLLLKTVHSQSKLGESDTNIQSIGLSIGIERSDVYSTITYARKFHSFSLNPSIGIGIVHSFFQANTFGRFGCDVFYNALDKKLINSERISLGIGLGYYFSFYKNPVNTYINETTVGYLFRYGKKIKIFQKTSFGLSRESFRGITKPVVLLYPNFHFSIGVSYEI